MYTCIIYIYIYIRLVSKIDQVMDNSPCLTIPNCWVQFCKTPLKKMLLGISRKCGLWTYIHLARIAWDRFRLFEGCNSSVALGKPTFLEQTRTPSRDGCFLLRSPSLLVKAQFLLVMLTLYLVSSFVFGW